MDRLTGRALRRPLFVALITALLMFAPMQVQAGLCPAWLCPPSSPPPSSPSPSPDPVPDPDPDPAPPRESPPPTTTPSPTPTPSEPGLLPGLPGDDPQDDPDDPFGEGEPPDPEAIESAELPPGLESFEVPQIRRTPPRNTVELVRLLEPLTELGIPLQQVLMEGMGRFPVAGLAYYSDDWLNPRFDPDGPPRFHQGLDIFADFGTPVRSPVGGVVSRFSNGGKGGTAVWVAGSDGASYYFAHLLARAEDLRPGQSVEIGTLLGFVGDSGNARGGPPHLHLETHEGGATPPKPSVDAWLDEAIEAAPEWVRIQRERILEARERLDGGTGIGGLGEVETSMLLTLLDPVGGSVGMLPSLNIAPRPSSGVSTALVSELIRSRVGGTLLVPSSREANLRH